MKSKVLRDCMQKENKQVCVVPSRPTLYLNLSVKSEPPSSIVVIDCVDIFAMSSSLFAAVTSSPLDESCSCINVGLMMVE